MKAVYASTSASRSRERMRGDRESLAYLATEGSGTPRASAGHRRRRGRRGRHGRSTVQDARKRARRRPSRSFEGAVALALCIPERRQQCAVLIGVARHGVLPADIGAGSSSQVIRSQRGSGPAREGIAAYVRHRTKCRLCGMIRCGRGGGAYRMRSETSRSPAAGRAARAEATLRSSSLSRNGFRARRRRSHRPSSGPWCPRIRQRTGTPLMVPTPCA